MPCTAAAAAAAVTLTVKSVLTLAAWLQVYQGRVAQPRVGAVRKSKTQANAWHRPGCERNSMSWSE